MGSPICCPRPLPAAVDHPRKAAFRNQKPSVPRYCYLFISKFTDRRELSVGVLCITQGTIATRPDPRCGCKFINLESGVLRITKAKFQTAGLCRASACRVRVFSGLGQLLIPKSACLRWSTAAAALSPPWFLQPEAFSTKVLLSLHFQVRRPRAF